VGRRERRKRLKLVAGLAVAFGLFGGGIALAAHATIIGQSDNTYNNGTYNTDQGEVSVFQVLGGTHNVTAKQSGPDGKPLFRSLTITGGTTSVDGTQYLTAGTYQFFCSVHPSTMNATLVVSGNGTPVPRPHGDLKLLTKKLSKARKRGLLVEIDMSAKIDGVNMVAKLGRTIIARANALALASGQQFEVLKLNKAGKNKLSGRSKATVQVSADIPFGSPASAKGKLK
jgi:plastocyanin